MIVVVGAGTAGCVVASRLSERADRQVLLLDAGADLRPVSAPVQLPVPGERGLGWYRAKMGAAGSTELVRGVRVGGSAQINGGYFVRPTRHDVADWYPGSPLWGWDRVKDSMRRLEHDLDRPARPGEVVGMIDLTRHHPGGVSSLAAAFRTAAEAAGHAFTADLNEEPRLGVGPVPRNVVAGNRSTPAGTYLAAARSRPNLQIQPSSPVERLEFDDDRRVSGIVVHRAGVEATMPVESVVLCAGAIESAAILMRSGIGPADVLVDAGVDVVVDHPSIGTSISEHPAVELAFIPVDEGEQHRDHPYVEEMLLFTVGDEGRIVEALLSGQSYGQATGAEPADPSRVIRIDHLQPRSRGTLRITGPSASDGVQIDLGHLYDERDLDDLVDAVQQVCALLGAAPMADRIVSWSGPDVDTVGDDHALRTWIVDHLTTCQHMSGSVPMGPEAVLDESLAVRGVTGVSVADTSVLPKVPSRGTAFTAVLLGELAASILAAD